MIPIRLAALFPPTAIQVNLYLVRHGRRQLYCRPDSPPSRSDLLTLQRSGILSLYTTAEEASVLHGQFEDMLATKASMPPEVHFAIAREVAKAGFSKAWKSPGTESMLRESAGLADAILDACDNQRESAAFVRSLLLHDGDTFTHVTNVSVYAVILLKRLGISDKSHLTALAQGALLHDLGKRLIHQDLLKKPGRLSSTERELLMNHPRWGFEEVCANPNLDKDQLLMIYHHHEKPDGSGYPVGLRDREIHWTARICAIVDVFDALTAQRPYRRPLSIEQAITHQSSQSASQFDPEYLDCWIKTIRN
ncbi:MAG: HD domain-containing protein [Pirellulales bacterium]|nr:HD domain-containing protein [Pirellulales bacterium]